MKVTTFFWKQRPLDLHLIANQPHPLDYSGYSIFGFDALQFMYLLGDLEESELQFSYYCLQTRGGLPSNIAETLMVTFPAEVVINEAPINAPVCVSTNALMHIEDLFPAHERFEWICFCKSIMRLMRFCCLRMRDYLNENSYNVQSMDDEEVLKSQEVYPTVPIRVMIRKLQEYINFASYEPEIADTEELKVFYFDNKSQFVNEKELKAYLGIKTDKDVRDELVKRGYLLPKNRSTRYKISARGHGYGIEHNQQRHWHVSLIKLLEIEE